MPLTILCAATRPRNNPARAFAAILLLAALHAPGCAAGTADSVFLEDLTWTELRDAVAQGKITAIIPIGGTEQSGPALALGKHNTRVRLLCGRIASELGNTLVAPVIAYVPEGALNPPSSHMRFPGTLTVPVPVFEATLEAAARSLHVHGFRNIVFLGDHGGYQRSLVRSAERLNREWSADPARAFAPAEYFQAASEGFAKMLRERGFADKEIGTHAALADTSLQLAAEPAMVRKELLHSDTRFDASVGVYGGTPGHASAELGRLGLDEIVRQSVAAIRRDISSPRPALPHP